MKSLIPVFLQSPVAWLFFLAIGLSACTKAQLIGNKNLAKVKAFSVISITPSQGPKAGGTNIFLAGTGFTNGMTIQIGGVTCGSLTVLSSVAATCVTGADSVVGAEPVAVVNGDGSHDSSLSYTYLGTMNTTGTRIAAGGNAVSSGGAGVNKVYARTTVGANTHVTGNSSNGGAGANKVYVRGGVIGVVTLH